MEAEMYVHAAEPLRANMATCIPRLRGGGGVHAGVSELGPAAGGVARVICMHVTCH
uniref:Predicted protein n=1 Tax=Hordeum vulgare subsp. vulgare TaxID=112509 RepID=F2DJF4_HORVV|nr:predicted protein [Hordeum vulgare subsp. vulgare]